MAARVQPAFIPCIRCLARHTHNPDPVFEGDAFDGHWLEEFRNLRILREDVL